MLLEDIGFYYGKSRRGVKGKKQFIGKGYVYLPAGLTKEIYIQKCLNSKTISLLTPRETLHQVRISQHMINDLIFPDVNTEVGSQIIVVGDSVTGEMYGIGIVQPSNQQISTIQNKQFSIKKETENHVIEILGDGKEGNLILNVSAKLSGLKNKLKLNVTNGDNEGELDVVVAGKINIESDNINIFPNKKLVITIDKTVIVYENGKGFSYKDEFENEFIIDGDGKFTIKNKGYSMMDLFNDIIDEVSKSTVATSLGTQPLLNATQIQSLKQNVQKLLK